MEREEAGKWAALLQPIKQLEKNWDINIAAELTDYLEELSALTFAVDGLVNLNFAEAAMVVYSSSCTYGKKVEYLMKLVKGALEGAKAKHGEAQATRKRKANANVADHSLRTYHDLVAEILAADCCTQLLDAEAATPLEFPDPQPPLLVDIANAGASQTVANQVGYVHNEKTSAAVTAMTPSDAPSFSMMRCHVHPSGAFLLVAGQGSEYDANLQSGATAATAQRAGPTQPPAVQDTQGAAPSAAVPNCEAAFGSPVAGVSPVQTSSQAVGADDGAAMDQVDSPGGVWYGPDDGPNHGPDAPPDENAHGADAAPSALFGSPCDEQGGREDAMGLVEPNEGGDEGAEQRHADETGSQQQQQQVVDQQVVETEGADEEGAEDEEGVPDVYAPLNAHEADAALKERRFKELKPKVPKFRKAVKMHRYRPFDFPDASLARLHHLRALLPQAAAADMSNANRRGSLAPPALDAVTPRDTGPATSANNYNRPVDDAGLGCLSQQGAGLEGEAVPWLGAEMGEVDGGVCPDFACGDDYDNDNDGAYPDFAFDNGGPADGSPIDDIHDVDVDDDGAGAVNAAMLYCPGQASQGSLAYDDLVSQYSQAVAAAAIDVQLQSDLSIKVNSWKESITDVMLGQEHHPVFDIQVVGQQIVKTASDLSDTDHKQLAFGQIVRCEKKYQVARCFSAFLQQVNNGAVDLIRGATPMDPFFVRVM